MASGEAQLADMLVKSNSTEIIVLESCLYALILSALLFGNLITLLVLVLNRLMRTVPNMFVASLAITDLSVGIFASILSFYSGITSHWFFGDEMCQFQGFISVTLALASIHTMALMAVNRYFRVVKPAKYRQLFTKKKTMIMIVTVWIYSMCSPLYYILSGQKMVYHPFKYFCILQQFEGNRLFEAIKSVVYIGIPSFVIFFSYSRIFLTVRNHNLNFNPSNGTRSSVNVEEIKVTHTLFVIVVCFHICWVPILAIDLVDIIHGRWISPREVYLAYSFLGTISSAVNPIILVLINRKFRRGYLKVLRCSYCRNQRVAPIVIIG